MDLFELLEEGNIKKIRKAVKEGVDLEEINSNGETPLQFIAIKGLPAKIALELMKGEVNINGITSSNSSTALHLAIHHGRYTLALVYANHPEIDFEAKDHNGKTVLETMSVEMLNKIRYSSFDTKMRMEIPSTEERTKEQLKLEGKLMELAKHNRQEDIAEKRFDHDSNINKRKTKSQGFKPK